MSESTVRPKTLTIRKIENGQVYIYYRANITPEQREDPDGNPFTMWTYDQAEHQMPTPHTSKAALLAAIRTDATLRSKLAAMAAKQGVSSAAVENVTNWTNASEITASPHWAVVNAFNAGQAKPLNVTRNWCGHNVELDCYVTQDVVDAYQGGNLSIGDYVLVDFVDGDLDKPLAVQKIYKSW